MYYNGMKNGHGKFQFGESQLYIGEFLKDKYHGQGTLIHLKNKKKKKLNFWNNNDSDEEEPKQIPKSFYKGSWLNGVKHGEGTELFEDGITFTGTYKKGKICGNGVAKDPSKRMVTGEFDEQYRGIVKATNFS